MVPRLAESWELDKDTNTYTFHLRQDVTWHDGEKFTAEDVKFTIEAIQDPKNESENASNYEDVEKITVVDDHTVKFQLSAPNYAFLDYMTMAILPKHLLEGKDLQTDDYFRHPIGTGPYKFVEWVSGDHTTLTANEDYWGTKPTIKNIVIQVVADTNTQILGLQNGDYDVVRSPSIDVCTRLDGNADVAWDSTLSTGRISLYLNDWTGACKDINFRKAVQAGIDKQMINDGVYAGRSEILNVDMCSNYLSFVTEADGVEVVPYDQEAAKEYLAKSNYNGEEFAVSVPSGSALENVGKIIQAQLMEIGINCTVKATDYPTYSGEFANRTYEAYIINNLCSLVDADGMYTAHRLDRKPWENRVFQRDGEISEILLKARAAKGDERKALYVEACNIVAEEAYDVPLVNDLATIAYRSNMSGVKAHCLGNMYFGDWSFN